MRVIFWQILCHNSTRLQEGEKEEEELVCISPFNHDKTKIHAVEEVSFFTCKSSLSFSVKGCLRLTFLPSSLTTFNHYFMNKGENLPTKWILLLPWEGKKKRKIRSFNQTTTYKLWRGPKCLCEHMVVTNKGLHLFSRGNNRYRDCYKFKIMQELKIIKKKKIISIKYSSKTLTIAFRIFTNVFC